MVQKWFKLLLIEELMWLRLQKSHAIISIIIVTLTLTIIIYTCYYYYSC